MSNLVHMLIICWTIQDGELREAWRLEKPTPRPVCWLMNSTMSGGGRVAAITITCSELKP